MKKFLVPISALLSLAAGQMAGAFSIDSTVGGAPTGVNYLHFNDLVVGNPGGTAHNNGGSADPSGTVTVTISPDGKIVTGSVSGEYAAPFLSNGQGSKFDLPVGHPDGVDASIYLTSGKTPATGGDVTLTFTSGQLYFGLLWGSVDDYNTLSFYDGNTLVKAVTGSDVATLPNGDQGLTGTRYVNINLDLPFNKVIATSSEYAFEFDNVAYDSKNVKTTSVPDGGSTLMVFGLSLVGLAVTARRAKLN